VAFALGFGGWTLYRALSAPDVVLQHHTNPHPWQQIDPASVRRGPSAYTQRLHAAKLHNVEESGVNKPPGEPVLTGTSTQVPRHW
jgi:hypothetical protein